MPSGLVGPGGETLVPGEPTPEEIHEAPMGPKESGELKEAQKEFTELDTTLGKIGKVLFQNMAAGFEILHRLGVNEERRMTAAKRAVKASGVHEDQYRGFNLDRGTVLYTKKKAK